MFKENQAEVARLLLTRPWKSHNITSATFDCFQVRPAQIQDGRRGELDPTNLWKECQIIYGHFLNLPNKVSTGHMNEGMNDAYLSIPERHAL